MDGSAPMSNDHDGKLVEHQVDLYEFRKNAPKPGFKEWDTPDYVAARRIQNEKRVEEYLEVSRRILTWNKTDDVFVNGNIKPPAGFSFKGKLNTKNGIHGIGHSYGGCCVLTSVSRQPQNFRSAVAHDPAVDWIAEDARKHIESGHKSGYTGGRPYLKPNGPLSKGLDTLPIFVLYCSDWIGKQWGHSPIVIDKIEAGLLGGKGSKAEFVEDTFHFTFSDQTVVMPWWLNKVLNFVGTAGAVEKGEECFTRTFEFLKNVEGGVESKKKK